jgi:cellulose biosynthesis protein BcsQ
MKSVAVFSIKGGVGKTATAVNLAYVAATVGARRTLLWDLDPQGAATYTLRLRPLAGASARKLIARDAALDGLIQATDYANLDVLAADKSLRHLERQLAVDDNAKRIRKLLRSLSDDYDRIIIDAPPGLTELAEQLFRAVDCLVVPMLPSPLSLRARDQLAAHLAKHHAGKAPPLIGVYSMVDRRKALHRSTVEATPELVAIPYASAIEQMAVVQAPLGATAPKSAAARAFGELWTQVERRLLS